MVVQLEERIETLERELVDVRRRLALIEPEWATSEQAVVWDPDPVPVGGPAGRPREPEPAGDSTDVVPSAPRVASTMSVLRRPFSNVEELLGGRLLGLAGGVSVLVGAVFFVWLAIDRGWLGEVARVAIALSGSTLLLGVGVWLYERRGRPQAALAAVGAATAALYLSLAAGSALYGLLPGPVALIGASAVGVLATALAVRWQTRTVAALGILGCLLAPLFAGGLDGPGVLFLLVAYGAAAAVCTLRRWTWLAVASFVAAGAQLAVWSLAEPATVSHLAALAAFDVLTVAAAARLRGPDALLARISGLLIASGALLVGALGLDALPHGPGELTGGLWVGGIAAAHALLGVVLLLRRRDSDRSLAHVCLGTALVASDVAIGLLAGGVALTVAWATTALLIAFLVQRAGRDRDLLRLGLGGQLALALGHTLLYDAPPGSVLDSGFAGIGPLSAATAVAVCAFGSARLAADELPHIRIGLDALAAAALAFTTALALDGGALTATLAGLAVAIVRFASGRDAPSARFLGLGFLVLAIGHALAIVAPPDALWATQVDVRDAALALGAVGLAGWRLGRALEPGSPGLSNTLYGLAVVAVAYLVPLALDGVLVVVAWAGLAAALAWVRGRDETPAARVGGLALLGLAAAHAVAFEARPDALLHGADDLGAAVAALAAGSVAGIAAAAARPEGRRALAAGAGLGLLALASVATVSLLTPDGVGIGQDAQVALSALWAASGFGILWIGLRRRRRPLRLAGLALLVVALGKVFVFDLQALDSIWRVLSCIALGLVLLVAAFAYQRMRPVPPPGTPAAPR